MSVHWSSEIAKWEYRDLQATAMSVDYTGNNVLLAGRRWLAIKHLTMDDEPGDILKKFPRHSKYDATGAEWCQTYHGQKLCAISSNQRVDVYEWRGGNDLTCISSLRAHARVVSDTHFHRHDHNLIATCSIDTFTHLWDLRDARKPTLSLCAVAGASQVQWNRVTPHLVATAHDGDIKVWDYRKHSSPIHCISAHLCKIHGVDWSPHHEFQLVTSSHDGSIKFFDINNARRPENTIMTNFPVWRAIYTPFGSGLLTIGVGWGGMPRVDRAGVIGIWVGGVLTHRLVGHTDTVQTMVWRPNTSPANYQLVTWGRDQTLRLWSMPSALLTMCNHYLPDDESEEDNTSDTISYSSTAGSISDLTSSDKTMDLQMTKLSLKTPTTIDDEFDSIREMANIEVTDMNIETRTCQIRSERNGHIANLQVTFPKNLFEQTIPKFSWLSGTNIDNSTTIKILQAINRTGYRKKKEGQRCLLHCLKTLATCIDEIPVKPSEDSDSMKSSQRSQSESENAGDACVPFPRTSGAKWCGVDTLVVFTRPPNTRRMSLKHDVGTPRSMSSLLTMFTSGYSSISPHATTTPSPTNSSGFAQRYTHRHPPHSITTFYFQDRWKPQGRRTGSMRSRNSISGCSTPRVVLYEAANLFPIRRSFAEKYIIRPDNSIEMCKHNEKVATEEGEVGYAKSWLLAGLAAKALKNTPIDHIGSSEESMGWAAHPLCCNLVQTLITHYANAADIQMAAMLVCAFPVFTDSGNTATQSAVVSITNINNGNGASQYNNTGEQFSEIIADGWTLPVVYRSNSCSDPDYSAIDPSRNEAPSCILDQATLHQYYCFKRAYADILHRWQYFYVRTEVMKLVPAMCPGESVVEVRYPCGWCGKSGGAGVCTGCGRAALRCGVCALAVRGLAAACSLCHHAHHAHHALKWFAKRDSCPTGCGCKCIIEGNSVWKSNKFV